LLNAGIGGRGGNGGRGGRGGAGGPSGIVVSSNGGAGGTGGSCGSGGFHGALDVIGGINGQLGQHYGNVCGTVGAGGLGGSGSSSSGTGATGSSGSCDCGDSVPQTIAESHLTYTRPAMGIESITFVQRDDNGDMVNFNDPAFDALERIYLRVTARVDDRHESWITGESGTDKHGNVIPPEVFHSLLGDNPRLSLFHDNAHKEMEIIGAFRCCLENVCVCVPEIKLGCSGSSGCSGGSHLGRYNYCSWEQYFYVVVQNPLNPNSLITPPALPPEGFNDRGRIDTITAVVDAFGDESLFLTTTFNPYTNRPAVWSSGITVGDYSNVIYTTEGRRVFTAETDGSLGGEGAHFVWVINDGNPANPADRIIARELRVNARNYPESISVYDEFTGEPILFNVEKDEPLTITVFPMDLIHHLQGWDFELQSYTIELTISTEAPREIRVNPWQRFPSGFHGNDIRVHFSSPAHEVIGNLPYTVEIWDYRTPWDYDADPETAPTPIWSGTTSETHIDINTRLPELGLISDNDGNGYVPRYRIRISHQFEETEHLEAVCDYDYIYLIVMPHPLWVSFNVPENLSFIHSGAALPFTWDLKGSGDITQTIDVRVNNVSIPSFPQTLSGNARSTLIPPIATDEFRTVYRITLTAENADETTVDALTFEVFNPDAFVIHEDEAMWDNSVFIEELISEGRTRGEISEEILSRNRQIDLSALFRVDGGDPWDSVRWGSSDSSIVSVNRQQGNLWRDIETMSGSSFRADTTMMGIGHQDGRATITSTHVRSGMTATIDIDVATLVDKLYLITVFPAMAADVTFTNGVGDLITVRTNARGEVAIYEPEGIVGNIRFSGTRNGNRYLGSINVGRLATGEQNPGLLQLYPMNRVRIRQVSNQTFFLYNPDGTRFSGNVTINGGAFNGSDFLSATQLCSATYSNASVTNGRLDIVMDSTNFEDEHGNVFENLRFEYELIFPCGQFAPRLIDIEGFASESENIILGDGIIHLTRAGDVFNTARYLYSNDFETIDVTNSTTFVGMCSQMPVGALVVNIATAPDSGIADSLNFTDSFGHTPVAQSVRNIDSTRPFLSGVYTYYALEMTVDENLRIEQGEARYFNICGRNNDGVTRRVNVPFGIVNRIGIYIPESMLNFNFSLAGAADATDPNRSANSTQGASRGSMATDILSSLAPGGIPIPDVLPFRVTIDQVDGNPLVYRVRGVFDFNQKDDKDDNTTYFWSANGEGEGTYRVHKKDDCFGLNRVSTSNMRSGTLQLATSRGILGGFCRICAKDEAEKAQEEFNNARESFERHNNNQGRGQHTFDTSTKLTAHFIIDIGFDIHTRSWVLEWKELGMVFKFNMDYSYSFTKPIPAGPVPLVLVIGFATGMDLTIQATIRPSQLIGGSVSDSVILDVKANGYFRLRGGIGLDIWVAAANVGIFGQVDLATEFRMRVLALEAAARYKVTGTVGLDLEYRIGPPIRIFGRRLFKNGRIVLWQATLFDTGYRRIFGNQEIFNSSSSVLGANLLLQDALVLQRLHNIPVELLPTDTPAIAVGNDFAIAAWTSMNLDEDELVEIYDRYGDELEFGSADLIGLANLSEIVVSVYQNGTWSEPHSLTENLQPNMSPTVAIHNGRAVVVWQRISLVEDGDGLDVSVTELWYSYFENGTWSGEPTKIGTTFDGVISDYSVALNDSGFALAVSVQNNEGENSTNTIFTLLVDNNDEVTKNMVTFDTNLNVAPQINTLCNDTFVLSYYTEEFVEFEGEGGEVAFVGSADIKLMQINADGSIIETETTNSVKTAADLLGLTTTNDYRLIVGNNGEISVAWATFDSTNGGYGIYAVKLVENNGTLSFTAPIALVEDVFNARISLIDGVINGNEITVLYNSINESDFTAHVATENADAVLPSTNILASGEFVNDVVFAMNVDDFVILPDSVIPVDFALLNSGTGIITAIDVAWSNGTTSSFPNLQIFPGEMFNAVIEMTIGSTVENLTYDLVVTFSNGSPVTIAGNELIIANPDISIGNITLIRAEHGERDFAINLFSNGDVALRNSGFSVVLSFFSDPMLTEPLYVVNGGGVPSSVHTISSLSDLALIDEGGLSKFFTYAFDNSDLHNGEIPNEGLRVFVSAEIIDSNGDHVVESCYAENRSSVLLESLLSYGQEPIIARVDVFDSSSTTIDVSVINNSMQEVAANSGRIVATMFDEHGGVLEVLSSVVNTPLIGEDFTLHSMTFADTGFDIDVRFVPLSVIDNDSTLASLTLSEVPFIFDSSLAPVNGIVQLLAVNVHEVETIRLMAVASNSNAVISVNGVEFTDIADVEIAINGRTRTTQTITVTTGESVTVYELVIITGSEVQSVTATPNTGTARDRTVTVTGINFPENVLVGAFRGSATTPAVTAIASGSSTEQTATLTLAQRSTANRNYTIRVSVDGGATWMTTPSANISLSGTGSSGTGSGSTRNSTSTPSCSECGERICECPDTTPPTGTITVRNNAFTTFIRTITFGLFFRDVVQVTITADDDRSGIASIEYYLSSTVLPLLTTDWNAIEWILGNSFNITPNWQGVIYARITDNAGNYTIISTNGIVVYECCTEYPCDCELPVVTTPTDGTGTTSPDDTGTTPPDGTGTAPPDGTGTTPPDGTGTTPPDGTGTAPPDDTGTTSPDDTGTTPPDGTGTTPPDGTGTTPPDGTGTAPPDGTGTTPPNDNEMPNESLLDRLIREALDDEERSPFVVLSPETGSVISVNALNMIRERGRSIKFELENGVVILIHHTTISDNPRSIDLNFDVVVLPAGDPNSAPPIPTNSIAIYPATHGEFGFVIQLILCEEKLNEAEIYASDRNAKLYHVVNGVPARIGGLVTNHDGTITIVMERASYYVLTEGEFEFVEPDNTPPPNNTVPEPPTGTETPTALPPPAPSNGTSPQTGITVTSTIVATLVAGAVAVVARKRRKAKDSGKK
jgi:hypothetical protein